MVATMDVRGILLGRSIIDPDLLGDDPPAPLLAAVVQDRGGDAVVLGIVLAPQEAWHGFAPAVYLQMQGDGHRQKEDELRGEVLDLLAEMVMHLCLVLNADLGPDDGRRPLELCESRVGTARFVRIQRPRKAEARGFLDSELLAQLAPAAVGVEAEGAGRAEHVEPTT